MKCQNFWCSIFRLHDSWSYELFILFNHLVSYMYIQGNWIGEFRRRIKKIQVKFDCFVCIEWVSFTNEYKGAKLWLIIFLQPLVNTSLILFGTIMRDIWKFSKASGEKIELFSILTKQSLSHLSLVILLLSILFPLFAC